jgi:transcriptional regulator with XRE-family HTH domain
MSDFSFRAGELTREIALRGLSQQEFAVKAEIDRNSVTKAVQGRRLSPRVWGKILIALGAIPVPEVPANLSEQAV